MSIPPPAIPPAPAAAKKPVGSVRGLRGWFRRNLDLWRMVIYVAIIGLVVTFGSIWIVVPTWNYGKPLTPDQWGAMQGFAGVVTFAFAVGGGIFILNEVRENNDARNLEIYQDIYEKFMNDAQIESRRILYTQLPDNADPVSLSEIITNNKELHAHFKSVLNVIDYFGFLSEQKWVTEEAVIGWVSPIVVKVWAKIGGLVEYERAQRPTEPDYYRSAIDLAQRCQKWRARELGHSDETIIFSKNRL